MTDYIHDFPLHVVTGYQDQEKDVRLSGYEIDFGQLLALRSMFSRAEYNVQYMERPSGPSITIDLTADQRNIRMCNFGTTELISGWYALKSLTYSPRAGRVNYYPWRIILIRLGALQNFQSWYETDEFAAVTNDWSI